MIDNSAHHVSFQGTIRWRELRPSDSDLLITDRESSLRISTRPGDVVLEEFRPSRAAVEHASDTIRRAAPKRILAVGGGSAIDTAKLAWLAVGPGAPHLVIAPCGREPWRAFAPFAVVLDPAGGQSTMVDERLGRPEVLLVRELLDAMTDDVLLVTALDVLVTSIESLLTTRSQPFSRALANAAGTLAIDAITTALRGGRPDAESVVVAGALSAEAFTSTGLGLAHAISTHLAALLQSPQDRVNAIAGRWVAERWGDHSTLATLRLTPSLVTRRPGTIHELIQAALVRLGIGTLRLEGVVRGDVELVLPLITGSSGIPWLPDELSPDEIRTVVLGLCDPPTATSPHELQFSSNLDCPVDAVFDALLAIEGSAHRLQHVRSVEIIEERPHRRLVRVHEQVDGRDVIVTSRFVHRRPDWFTYEDLDGHAGVHRGRYDLVDRGTYTELRHTLHTDEDLASPSLRQARLERMRATHQTIANAANTRHCPRAL